MNGKTAPLASQCPVNQEQAKWTDVALTPATGVQYPEVLLIIPTLNEEAGLPQLLRQARLLGLATLVADADSTDGTRQVARDFGVPVVQVARGKGRGWAELLSRFDYSAWEYVAMVDGDASYDLLELPRLLESGADMVVGRRRRLPGNTTPLMRRFGAASFSLLTSLLSGRWCPDPLSGFRLMRSSCLRQIPVTSRNFELEVELTLRFIRRGFSISWVDTGYRSRLGRSKLSAFKDGWAILRAILRYRNAS